MTVIDRLTASALMVLGGLVLSAGKARADDWPMFGRDRTRNAVSPEKNAPTEGHVKRRPCLVVGNKAVEVGESRNIKWSARLGSTTVGCPVVAKGLVWIGTN